MSRPRNEVPTLRRHKAKNLAYVVIDGKPVYLGPWNSPTARLEYEKLLARLRAGDDDGDGLTVSELIVKFLEFAAQHYRHPDGTPTDEQHNLRLAFRVLREAYSHLPATEFGPKCLKQVREVMVGKGWVRKQVNGRVGRIKRMFKWAASEELVPVEVYTALATVAGLQAGRSAAPDNPPVQPVPAEAVEKTLPHLNRQVAGLVRFQLYTGCRPGEACRLRWCDVDTSADPWRYVPATHKTEWRGKRRVILIGPRGRELLEMYPTADPTAFVFNPAAATAEHHAARSAARTTKRYVSHMKVNAAKKKAEPKRTPGARYTDTAYITAVGRACERAGVPHWHPNQIRHLAATEIGRAFGLETARTVLGHASVDTTTIYAERDEGRAADAVRKVG